METGKRERRREGGETGKRERRREGVQGREREREGERKKKILSDLVTNVI